jgi:hypothetical protein
MPGQTPSLATSLKSFLVALCVNAILYSRRRAAYAVTVSSQFVVPQDQARMSASRANQSPFVVSTANIVLAAVSKFCPHWLSKFVNAQQLGPPLARPS